MPAKRPAKQRRGYIDAGADVARQLRKATLTLVSDACRSLPYALTDERRLEQQMDSLDEMFELLLLRTLFGMLGRPDSDGRVRIDATDHLQPLLEGALEIARNATAEELRRATTAQQRKRATDRAIELQIIARQLVLARGPRAARGFSGRS